MPLGAKQGSWEPTNQGTDMNLQHFWPFWLKVWITRRAPKFFVSLCWEPKQHFIGAWAVHILAKENTKEIQVKEMETKTI